MHVRAQAAPRRFDVELIVICQRFQHLEVIEVAAIPASDRTASQRQFRILDHAVRIEILLHAKAVTGRAGPCRVVKRKQSRLQFTHTVAANWAGEISGEQQLFRFRVVHIRNYRGTTGKLQRGFKRLCQTLGEIVTHLEAINHHFNGMFLLQFQFRRIGKIADFAINTSTDVTLACQIFQRFGVFAFALFNDWREQHQAFTFRLRQHVIHHLADGLRRQRYIVVRAARLTDAGEQQTQIVVDFGDCPHRRTRVMRRRFLLNRDGRRKPLNMIDVRLFHQ